jgi:hypothetical protein
MKKNLGSTDRIIRAALFVFFAVLYFTNTVTGTLGLVLFIAGIVLLATSLINWCPIYAVLGLNSCKRPTG